MPTINVQEELEAQKAQAREEEESSAREAFFLQLSEFLYSETEEGYAGFFKNTYGYSQDFNIIMEMRVSLVKAKSGDMDEAFILGVHLHAINAYSYSLPLIQLAADSGHEIANEIVNRQYSTFKITAMNGEFHAAIVEAAENYEARYPTSLAAVEEEEEKLISRRATTNTILAPKTTVTVPFSQLSVVNKFLAILKSISDAFSNKISALTTQGKFNTRHAQHELESTAKPDQPNNSYQFSL